MIRQATYNDLNDIIRIYKLGLEELGHYDYKEELLIQKVEAAFMLAPCFLVEVNGNIMGMAGFTLGITSHNGDATLCDYMFYVEPEARNINTLGGLMEEIKQFADANKLPVKLEFICNNDDALRRRMFKKYGFEIYSVMGMYRGL